MNIAPLFISHGAPDILTTPSAAHRALSALSLPASTRAVLVISAHWEAEALRVQGAAKPGSWRDYGDFGPALATARYDAPGAPDLAVAVVSRLQAAGLPAVLDQDRPRDHGAWIPLALIRPDADLPVFQISLPTDDAGAVALGEALAPLTATGLQIIASGSLTHALEASLGAHETAPVHPRAQIFADWVRPRLKGGDWRALGDWPAAPEARFNHPTPEHFRPLLVAMAAAPGRKGTCLHQSWSRSALAMDIWRFAA